ncbi:hypothetical protein ISG33_06295 [Glaciecola sp. MH2013]|uniref:hypothetical protein n=1 Tax=Glaciecola sp. MH2013 TaxID=2785524 RepID=UPI00189DF16D|nr:hypothetical protein [Glaciecola sp. MH2013]MBF7073006.1 hypothetical protein [Glaciecola sp. MH2013]
MSMNKLLALVLTLFVLLASAQGRANTSCEISYPAKQSEIDTRNDYPLELLQAILKATEADFGQCALKAVGPFNQKRTKQALLNRQVDIAWLPATASNNDRFLAIKVPLRKGLLGWRLLMVNTADVARFESVESLQDLQKFRTAFGADWQDLAVMKSNFDAMVLGSDYEQLFKMLHHGRFDFFSRGLHEVADEIEYHKADGYDFSALGHLMLRYKAVDLFYLAPNNKELFARIRKGMNAIIVNGQFNELFYSYYAHYIEQANMKDKAIFELENPDFPDEIEYKDPQLWFQLNDL